MEKLYLYPLWLRIWHGVNALGIVVLIVSGISMQYPSTKFTMLDFGTAVNMHNIAGVIVSFSFLLFFLGNMFTKNRKFYRIKPKGLRKRLVKQAKYYIHGMFNDSEAPFPISEKRKFNPLQKYSYVAVMYFFVPVIIITGIALLFPELIIEEIYAVSGVMITAVLHGTVGFLIFIFLLIHLYVASLGKPPLKNFKSIINGWH
ncbi:MAG: cytochrome B [Prolixibacteraceae bacterium]|nr:cytochrome B [Prolixibacteraceae bacterium]MBT7397226.1 cytochrome B [Prolixibacteraceae bacterium]